MAERPRSWEKSRTLSKDINKNALRKIESLKKEVHEKYNISEDTVKHLTSLKLEQHLYSSFDSTAYRELLRNELLALEIQEHHSEGETGSLMTTDTKSEHDPEASTPLIDTLLQIRILQEQIHAQLSALKEDIDVEFGTSDMITKNLYSSSLLDHLDHPQHIGHQIAGVGVWLLESVAVAGKISGEIVWGIIKTPYDIVEIARKKAEVDSRIDI